MFNYLARRVLIGLLTLLLITFLVYGLVRSMPGDPLLAQLEQLDPGKKRDSEHEARLRKAYGLDDPIPVGYLKWVKDLAFFDLGTSFRWNVPVTSLIGERVFATLLLSSISIGLAYLLAIPLGLWSTVRGGNWDERSLSLLLYLLYSLPIFVAALLLQLTFHVHLGWLPLQGMKGESFDQLSFGGKVVDLARHALLPVVCETYGLLAYYSRFIRTNMQEVIRQDYIRTARAKGATPFSVIVRHAFRNTLIPLVTMLGLTLPALLSGAIILEQIFNWPGMGSLFFKAIGERDYPTIMGLVLIFSSVTLLGQLLADFLYSVVDPRVTYN